MIVLVDPVKNIKNVADDRYRSFIIYESHVKKTILVTGGAGYIGSHTAWLLYKQGCNVVVIDNLRSGYAFEHAWCTFVKGNIEDTALLEQLFLQYSFSAVFHFAASIEVSESCKDPLSYYKNNVVMTQILLEMCVKHGIKNVVFSSSCAVYGNPETATLNEHHPKNPISPYGRTKLIVEQMLEDCANAYDFKYVALRYFNAAGMLFQEGLYEQHNPESHVIPRMINALMTDATFFMYGIDYPTHDGSAVRDYVHVLDIADAHVKAFEYLELGKKSAVFNLGTGKGSSVLDLVTSLENIVNKKLIIKTVARRAGDPAYLVADSVLAQTVLGWKPVLSSLPVILKSAYLGLLDVHSVEKKEELSFL